MVLSDQGHFHCNVITPQPVCHGESIAPVYPRENAAGQMLFGILGSVVYFYIWTDY